MTNSTAPLNLFDVDRKGVFILYKILYQFPYLLVYRCLGDKFSTIKGFMTEEELEKYLTAIEDLVHHEIYDKRGPKND